MQWEKYHYKDKYNKYTVLLACTSGKVEKHVCLTEILPSGRVVAALSFQKRKNIEQHPLTE